ncbi:unnamed protein product [Rangifer tarandus platyrhynchus]|uniref:Uncharacterized protein n=1 Tax=Rangifer tarandus platyrhynchus TaxID=3082113 RepID=A0ABN9A650_RANTA|nr:unnamed protein product [Rangifer tarandus platyrhynchus]
MEEGWDIEPLEEEIEGGLEEMEENEEEDESDFELEDLEEEEKHLLEEVEEEKETVEDEESEQEVAAMVAGHRDPLEQFGPVFWGLVHSLLRSLSYDDHVLVWPPDTRLMVRRSSQPPSGPGEGPAPPQEQEDLGEGGKASQVPKSVLYFTKEASDYQYEESDEEVQEAEGEEDSNEKPEEGPEKDLDPAEDSPGEPRSDSFLRALHNNKYVLFRPHADCLMARGRSQPLSDPGEAPVPPQEQEDLGEGGKVLQGLDSAADFKLGYFSCQLLTPKSASLCPNDEGEYQYENTDEEEEDGNEKPEEGLEMDVVSAKGSAG